MYDAAVVFLIYVGCRPAEMAGLRVKHLHLLKGTVHICETLTEVSGRLYEGPTKTDQERLVPLPMFLVEILAEHLIRREAQAGRPLQADDWVFAGVKGEGLRTKWFREAVIRPALRDAGLPDQFRTYDFRHAHASQVIHMGASPLAVQQRLGHADILTTFRRYGHLFKGVQETLAGELESKHEEATKSRQGRGRVVELRTTAEP